MHTKIKMRFAVVIVIESNDDDCWRLFEKVKTELKFLKLTTPKSNVIDAFPDLMLEERITGE